MVEISNRSILQMLRSFSSSKSDWEAHLPHLLFAYRTSQHSSTKTSPFTLMFGRITADSIMPTEFKVNDVVWLSVPTSSKLDYRWEGGWTVIRKGQSGVTLEIRHENG